MTAVNVIGTPVEKAESQNGFNLDGDVWSLYDDLSFLMYTDTEVAQLINKLEKKKFEAVATERFEYAKKIKSAISKLLCEGLMIKNYLKVSSVRPVRCLDPWRWRSIFLPTSRNMMKQRTRKLRWMSSGLKSTKH